jgi:hypothetical protein
MEFYVSKRWIIEGRGDSWLIIYSPVGVYMAACYIIQLMNKNKLS